MIVSGVLAALLAAIAIVLIATPAAAAPTWSDDFHGPAGSAPDPTKWVRETGGSGSGNNELQYYTDSSRNAALDGDGNLVITARRENPAGYQCWYGDCRYTSARLNTAGKFTQRYGRFEARIKIPRGQGMWPAFWMLGDNIGSVGWPASGEIDIVENIGREPNVVHGSLHGSGYSGGASLSGKYDLGRPVADDFHVFTVDWAPDEIAFSVDGHEYERRTPADTRGKDWAFDRPFFLILNLAVGGNWPGSPDSRTPFPQQMVVDYVHVFAKPGNPQSPTRATSTRGTVPTTAASSPPERDTGGSRPGTMVGFWGKCAGASGSTVVLQTCNGTDAQQWNRTGETVRAHGKCLDLADGLIMDGTRVVLGDCNETAAQNWLYIQGVLLNSASGSCLDILERRFDEGTPLQIWACQGGPSQRWLMANASTTPATTPAPIDTIMHPPTHPQMDAPEPTPSRTSAPPLGGTERGAMAAAPYLYLGWGNPPDPRTVMSATGIKWFTLAFMLDGGGCNPSWDGNRSLTGARDQTTINNIRSSGGDVVVSFGGASGPSLEQSCGSAGALAAAYRRVIDAYDLKAIDIDIEGGVYSNPAHQQKTIDALKIVKTSRPGVTIYVTIPSGRSGPDGSMIRRAASSGLTVDGWTIMPFDFGAVGQDMGALTIQAAEGLKNTIKSAYGYTDAEAYRHAGISSMNGRTDVGEIVSPADLTRVLGYAQQHHLARFTFWSLNRDRPCGGSGADSCSGISQAPWEFTRIVARYTG